MREYRLRLGSREIPIGRRLQEATPQTFIDGGGTRDSNRFSSQEITPEQLREYKEIRETGGAIASILEIKSLLTFGGGVEYHGDEDAVEWLEDNIPPAQLTLFSIQAGTDAYTYPGAPAEIVETRGGEFSHLESVEPFTVVPETDNHGDIVGFRQVVQMNGSEQVQRLDVDEIGYLVLIRSNGRDKTGVSLLERNRSEVENYLSTRDAVENSVQLHGFPQRHIRVGREGMSNPSDNDLRRIRQRFDRAWSELTMFVTGRDVEIDTVEATDFDFSGLTEDSLKTLMLSFILPQEAANVGSDGLGSGMPAELRKSILESETNARQNDFAGQIQEQLLGPILDEYSPYSASDLNRVEYLGPDLDAENKDELDRLQQKIDIGQRAADAGLDVSFEGDDLTIADGEFEQQEQGGLPGEGGLFGSADNVDFRRLNTPSGVPSNAQGPVGDRSDIPDGASTFQGPRGGLYFVPAGQEPENNDTEPADAESVIESIRNVDVDSEDEAMAERAMEKYGDAAETNVQNLKDPEVAQNMFDSIRDIFVNEFRTGINFQAGREKDQSSFEVQPASRPTTFHHELGHVIADAHGFGVSSDAARESTNPYNPDEDNFVPVDLNRDDIDEFRLTQLEGEDAPEEVENLIEATNEAWEKMQQTGQENPDDLDDVVVRDNYGAINAHETLAQMHETMQTDRLPTTGHANFFDEHPELTRAYVDVAEPSDRMKDLLSHLHDDRGVENSPFDENPYPERDV